MKCPKCGFTSFDFLESCKKCGADLQVHKSKFGLRSMIFPGFQSEEATPTLLDEIGDDSLESGAAGESIDFGFDFMSEADDSAEEPAFDADSEFDSDFGDDSADRFGEPLVEVGDFLTTESDDPAEDFLTADSQDEPSAETAAVEAEEEVLEAEIEIDFNDWESDSEEEIGKPPKSKEGPSDPFDFRESADTWRTPETFDHPEDLNGEAGGFGEPARDADSSGQSLSSGLSPESLEEVHLLPALTARISACLIDLLILATIFALFLAVGEMTVPSPEGERLFPPLATLLDLSVPYFLVLFALCFGYFTLFHFLTGQTPGKMLFKLRVESINGKPLLFSQAFLRSVGGLLSLLAAGIGYLITIFNRKGRGWNDLLAGSRVVPLFEEQIDEDDLTPFEI